MSLSRRIRKCLLYCAVALPPLLAGGLALVPWWLPQLVDRVITRKIAAAMGPKHLNYKLESFSLYHLELADFSADWSQLAVTAERIEVKYTPLAILRGELRQIGIHEMTVRALEDVALTTELLGNWNQHNWRKLHHGLIAGLRAERIFVREGKLYDSNLSPSNDLPLQFDSIVERQTDTEVRYWVKTEQGEASVEAGGLLDTDGNGETSTQVVLTIPMLSRLVTSYPWINLIELSEDETTSGKVRFEAQIQWSAGQLAEWVVLGSALDCTVSTVNARITGLDADFGMRGVQQEPQRFWVQSRGRLEGIPDIFSLAPQQHLQDLFPVLDLSWQGRIELYQSELSGSIQSVFNHTELSLPDAVQPILLTGLQGALNWKLVDKVLQSQLTSPLHFETIQLDSVTGGRGQLILESHLSLSHGHFDLRLTAPIDGQLQSWSRSYDYGMSPALR